MRDQKSRKAKAMVNQLTDEREGMLNALGLDWKAATN
jgi:hypothetical protein